MSTSTQKTPPVFEFCKRKRWADLAIGELGDAILLVLSPATKVLYCGNAVTELLGWRDDEVLDLDFGELIATADQASFMNKFNESLRNNSDMLSYVRLKPKKPFVTTMGPSQQQQQDSQAVLFEIRGYPHFTPALSVSQCQCFFAAAKPYPSRNMAMLNAFIDVKLENERLLQRIQALRARSDTSGSFTAPQGMPVRGTTASAPSNDSGGFSYSHYNTSTASFDEPQASTSGFEQSSFVHGGAGAVERDEEEFSKKRKLNKMHLTSQHVCVTCGRTDSPEWRKGPQGPKTLCNACGLRWAKSTRSITATTTAES